MSKSKALKKLFYGLLSKNMLTILLTISTINLIYGQDPKEGDYQSISESGIWEEPLTWQKYKSGNWGEYGEDGIPDETTHIYIVGEIDLNHSIQVNHLTILSNGSVTNHSIDGTPTILSIKGNLMTESGSLFKSTNVDNHFKLNGNSEQNLKIQGDIGTNTHLVLSGSEVMLKDHLNLTHTNTSLIIEDGNLNFNHFNILGNGKFYFSSGILNITSRYGVNSHAEAALKDLGNVRNLSTRRFSGTGTYVYSGIEDQVTGNGIPGGNASFKNIIIDNPTSVSLTTGTGINEEGKLEIKRGTFIETNEAYIKGSGNLIMEDNTFYKSSVQVENLTGDSGFPSLTINSLSRSSTIELNAPIGNQKLQGQRNYANLTFSGGGVKSITSATENIDGTVVITGDAILDVESFTFGKEATNFTMTGGRFRSSKLNVAQPEMEGEFDLTGGVVELYGSISTKSQTLQGGKTYFNIELNAASANTSNNNVNQGSGNIAISGSFNVNAPTVFEMGANQNIEGNGSFQLHSGATLKYGNKYGITDADECKEEATCGNIRTPTRVFPEDASYGFVGSSTDMESGNGLPSKMKNLYVSRESDVILLHNIEVEGNIAFTDRPNGTGGLLITGENQITLSASGNLYETEKSHILGKIKTTRDVDNGSNFGGIGFEISNPNANPGLVTVTRTTGTSIEGEEGSESILRYFEVEAENQTFEASIKIKYLDAELNNIMEGDLLGFQSASLNENWLLVGGDLNELSNSITIAPVNGERFWTLASSINPLPVSFLSFTGFIQHKIAYLNWETIFENNNEGFAIEKSEDGKSFFEIGFVNGGGSSSQRKSYSFKEEDVKQSYYYRLKQMDINGSYNYSDTIFLQVESPGTTVLLYPNPVKDKVNLRLSGITDQESLHLKIYNSSGVVVKEFDGPHATIHQTLNTFVPYFPEGLYIMVINSTSYKEVFKFYKD